MTVAGVSSVTDAAEPVPESVRPAGRAAQRGVLEATKGMAMSVYVVSSVGAKLASVEAESPAGTTSEGVVTSKFVTPSVWLTVALTFPVLA